MTYRTNTRRATRPAPRPRPTIPTGPKVSRSAPTDPQSGHEFTWLAAAIVVAWVVLSILSK